MSPVAHALLEHHEQLQELARQADKLPLLDANRSELRDLLQREFQPDMERPGGRLWLDAVIDDIARIVLGGATRELADGIRGAAPSTSTSRRPPRMRLSSGTSTVSTAPSTPSRSASTTWFATRSGSRPPGTTGCSASAASKSGSAVDWSPATSSTSR